MYRSYHAQGELLKSVDPNVWALLNPFSACNVVYTAVAAMEENTNPWEIGSNRS